MNHAPAKISQTFIIGASEQECLDLEESVTGIPLNQEFRYVTLRRWYAGREQLGNRESAVSENNNAEDFACKFLFQ
jgi:hypothetical protein